MEKRIEDLIINLKESTRSALLNLQLKNVPLIYNLLSEKVEVAKVGLDNEKFEEKIDYLWLINNPTPMLVTRYTDSYFRGSLDILAEQDKIQFPAIIESHYSRILPYEKTLFIYSERASYLALNANYKDVEDNKLFCINRPNGFRWVEGEDETVENYYLRLNADGRYSTTEGNLYLTFNEKNMDKYIIKRGRIDRTGLFIPEIDNKYKLFRCNFLFFHNGKLILEPDVTEQGYNIFKLNNIIESELYEYVCCYYIDDRDLLDNLSRIEDNLSVINDITSNSEDYENYISKIEDDFDYRFSVNKSYEENLQDALDYIIKYNQWLLDDLFKQESNTHTISYTGKEFNKLAVNGAVKMSRKIPVIDEFAYNNHIIMYVNGELYRHHDKISYGPVTVTILLPENLADTDIVEIVFFRNTENKVVNTNIKDEKYVFENKLFSDNKDIMFFTKDPQKNHLFEHLNMTDTVYKRVRYIRDSAEGNNIDNNNHLSEIRAFDKNGMNVAYKVNNSKIVDGILSTDDETNFYEFKGSYVLDLLDVYELDYIEVLHYYNEKHDANLEERRQYINHKLEVSEDGDVWTVVHDAKIHGDRVELPDGNRYIVPREYTKNLPALAASPTRYELPHEKISLEKGIRYIRNYMNGSDVNRSNHWGEIKAITSTGENIALKKPVEGFRMTADGEYQKIEFRNLHYVTDGDPSKYTDGYNGEKQYIEIDLLDIYEIEYIHMWHYYNDGRSYKENVLSVSADGINWVDIFDSEKHGRYVETRDGKKVFIKNIFKNHFRVNFLHKDLRNKAYNSKYDTTNTMLCRYLKHVLKAADTEHGSASWAEIEVYSKGVNVANGKTCHIMDTIDKQAPLVELDHITDGNTSEGIWVTEYENPAIILDLQNAYDIDVIKIFHGQPFGSAYSKSEVYISTDNLNWTKVFDNSETGTDYISDEFGNTISMEKTNYVNDDYYDTPIEVASARQFHQYRWNVPIEEHDFVEIPGRVVVEESTFSNKIITTGMELDDLKNVLDMRDKFITNTFYINTHSDDVFDKFDTPNSIRHYSGQIITPVTGEHTFRIITNSTVYFKLGGQEFLYNNHRNTTQYYEFTTTLSSGHNDFKIALTCVSKQSQFKILVHHKGDKYIPLHVDMCMCYAFGLKDDLYTVPQAESNKIMDRVIRPFNRTDRSVIEDTTVSNMYVHNFKGVLYASEEGDYEFSLQTNSQFRVEIDNEVCLENVTPQISLKETVHVSKKVYLSKGWHKFRTILENDIRDFNLNIKWCLPDQIDHNLIPPYRFRPYTYHHIPTLKLPKEFMYCQHDNQFIVFHNGRRLDMDQYTVKTPDLNTIYEVPVVIVNKKVEVLDYIDIFYTPQAHIEVYKKCQLEYNVDGTYNGAIELGESTLGYQFDADYCQLFINGKKISNSDIGSVTKNSVIIKKDIGTVHNITVLKNNTFSSTILDLLSKCDIWTDVVSNSKLKDLVHIHESITDSDHHYVEPATDSPDFLLWNTVYHFWIKRFSVIDPGTRFTYNEDESICYRVVPNVIIEAPTVAIVAHSGLFEKIEYTENETGDKVYGIRIKSANGDPKIQMVIGRFECGESKYHSMSFQVYANYNLYMNRPYVRVLDKDNNVVVEKYALFDYQNTGDEPPIGQWITMHVDELQIDRSLMAYVEIVLEVISINDIVEVKNAYLEYNKYSHTNLKILPIDASKVAPDYLPYTII